MALLVTLHFTAYVIASNKFALKLCKRIRNVQVLAGYCIQASQTNRNLLYLNVIVLIEKLF